MRIGVYSIFKASLEEKISKFICFYFHNYNMLQCCHQNHNNDNDQLIDDFMRIVQTSGEEPHYGIELFRNLKTEL